MSTSPSILSPSPRLPCLYQRHQGLGAGTAAPRWFSVEVDFGPTTMHRVTAAAVATVATVATLAAVVTATTPSTPIIAPAKALEALYSDLNSPAYEQCLSGTTCFFFIPEAPFTRIDADTDAKSREPSLDPRRLFPCIEYAERGLGGIGFKVHELIPNNTDMCAMLDPTDGWTFDMLIQMLHNSTLDPTHPGYGMGLGASGAVVPTESRANKTTASDSYMEVRQVGRGRGNTWSCGVA